MLKQKIVIAVENGTIYFQILKFLGGTLYRNLACKKKWSMAMIWEI